MPFLKLDIDEILRYFDRIMTEKCEEGTRKCFGGRPKCEGGGQKCMGVTRKCEGGIQKC